jgi:antitoxin ParD1/3/4
MPSWIKDWVNNRMNVSLTPELEKLVTRKVESGLYQSASEVIREGLRLLDNQDRLREIHLDEIRKKVQTGLDQLDRGEGIPGDEAYARMKQASREFRQSRK